MRNFIFKYIYIYIYIYTYQNICFNTGRKIAKEFGFLDAQNQQIPLRIECLMSLKKFTHFNIFHIIS